MGFSQSLCPFQLCYHVSVGKSMYLQIRVNSPNLIITCDLFGLLLLYYLFFIKQISNIKYMKITRIQRTQDIRSKLGKNPCKGETQKEFFSSYRIGSNWDIQDPKTKPPPSTKSALPKVFLNQFKVHQVNFILLPQVYNTACNL